jgi:hypothetical protein
MFDIFCNRELKMSHIKAIGFDMDYTLAQYQQPAFDQLAFDGAKEKLVHKLGYPETVLDFAYDHEVRKTLFWGGLVQRYHLWSVHCRTHVLCCSDGHVA